MGPWAHGPMGPMGTWAHGPISVAMAMALAMSPEDDAIC